MSAPSDINDLLSCGFTRRMGMEYLETLAREKSSAMFDDA